MKSTNRPINKKTLFNIFAVLGILLVIIFISFTHENRETKAEKLKQEETKEKEKFDKIHEEVLKKEREEKQSVEKNIQLKVKDMRVDLKNKQYVLEISWHLPEGSVLKNQGNYEFVPYQGTGRHEWKQVEGNEPSDIRLSEDNGTFVKLFNGRKRMEEVADEIVDYEKWFNPIYHIQQEKEFERKRDEQLKKDAEELNND